MAGIVIDLSLLSGGQGLLIQGDEAHDGAGDIDGDCIADVIVGARASQRRSSPGRWTNAVPGTRSAPVLSKGYSLPAEAFVFHGFPRKRLMWRCNMESSINSVWRLVRDGCGGAT